MEETEESWSGLKWSFWAASGVKTISEEMGRIFLFYFIPFVYKGAWAGEEYLGKG